MKKNESPACERVAFCQTKTGTYKKGLIYVKRFKK